MAHRKQNSHIKLEFMVVLAAVFYVIWFLWVFNSNHDIRSMLLSLMLPLVLFALSIFRLKKVNHKITPTIIVESVLVYLLLAVVLIIYR